MGNQVIQGANPEGGPQGDGDQANYNEQLIKKNRADGPDRALKSVMFKDRRNTQRGGLGEQGPGRQINYHKPPAMNQNQIFERYIKEIEEDFQFNHRKLDKLKQNEKSEFQQQKQRLENLMEQKKGYNLVKGEKISLQSVQAIEENNRMGLGHSQVTTNMDQMLISGAPSVMHELESNNNSVMQSKIGPGTASALQIQPKLDKQGNYTMMGLCFVSDESLDQIQQMREDLLKKFKHYDFDTYWAKMFVLLITHLENDIDLRLQKVLLQCINGMLQEQFSENYIDAAKYQRLYISKVYEQNKKSNMIKSHDDLLARKLQKLPVPNQLPSHVMQNNYDKAYRSSTLVDQIMEKDYQGPLELILDKIGMLNFPCNEITLTKFLTIEEHLSKKLNRAKISDEGIPTEHPLQRLNKKFNQYLHSILHQKINKEILELKSQYLMQLQQLTTNFDRDPIQNDMSMTHDNKLSDKEGSIVVVKKSAEDKVMPSEDATLDDGLYTIKDIQLVDIIDINNQNIFKFLLEKAIGQIEKFAQIQQSSMSGIYGEMEQKANYSNRMFNLIISQILESQTKSKVSHTSKRNKGGGDFKRQDALQQQLDSNAQSADKVENGISSEDMRQQQMYEKLIEQISEYQGVFNPDSASLSQTMRNLYSLSRRHDIVQIIGKLQNHNPNNRTSNFGVRQYQQFESAIYVISQEVNSPIAKANCYYQFIRYVAPEFHSWAADEQKASLQELLQGLQNFESIENLYIDIQMINDFISNDQRDILTQFMVVAHIQNLFIEIQNEGINIVGITKIDEEEEFKQQQNYEEEREVNRDDNVLRQTNGPTPEGQEDGPDDTDDDDDDEDSDDDDDDDDDEEDNNQQFDSNNNQFQTAPGENFDHLQNQLNQAQGHSSSTHHQANFFSGSYSMKTAQGPKSIIRHGSESEQPDQQLYPQGRSSSRTSQKFLQSGSALGMPSARFVGGDGMADEASGINIPAYATKSNIKIEVLEKM